MLTGPIGCGKTSFLQQTLLSLPADVFEIALVQTPRLSTLELLQLINHQFKLASDSGDKTRLIRQLHAFAVKNARAHKETLICIDEAQSIPSLASFEELRLLLNIQLPSRAVLNLLLCGQPELLQKTRKLPQLMQRMAVHIQLEALSLQEAARYLLYRLYRASCRQPMLSRKAVESLYQYSEGLPRRINFLMDSCLMLGMRQQVKIIDKALVQQAQALQVQYAKSV